MRHLVRFYPKRWRERYGAELEALIERTPATVRSFLDVLRGVVDAHLHPELARELVYVPEIGFRPSGTRALLERSTTRHGDATVTVLAVAASPDRTDIVVEWESHAPETLACALPRPATTPDGRKGILIAAATPGGADEIAVARLVVPHASVEVDALNFGPRAFLTRHGWSVHTITFPPLPASADRADLRLTLDGKEWRAPIELATPRIGAVPIAVETRSEGIVIRATAVGRRGDEVMVAIEVEGEDPRTLIGSIGASSPPLLPPRVKPPASWKLPGDALVLLDERGGRAPERRRMHQFEGAPMPLRGPQQPRRFISIFGPVHPDARRVTLSVPWAEVNELDGDAKVDLRSLPTSAELNGHPFDVLGTAASPLGPNRQRVVLRVAASDAPRRFVRPLGVFGSGGDHAWGEEPDGTSWMDTFIGDPPIVSFRGAAIRVHGGWTLHLELP